MSGLFTRKEKPKVYCQSCGLELKDDGYVSNEGGIYCPGGIFTNFDCGTTARNELKKPLTFEKFESKQFQALIEKGKLTNFGLLEKFVSK
jgi:hypothetical protein